MNKKEQVSILKPSFLISLEDSNNILTANSNVFELLGFKADSFLSGEVSIQNLIHSHDQDISDLLFLNESKLTSGNLNFRIRNKEGCIVCVKASYRKIIKPIDNRPTLELLLQDSRSLFENLDPKNFSTQFHAMMENSEDYIYFKDRNHLFTGASQAFVNLTPSKHWTDLLGKSNYDVFPENYADTYHDIEKQVFNGSYQTQEILEFIDNQGNKGWVKNLIYPLLDNNKDIIGLFGIAHNVTESIKTQETLYISQKELLAANQKNDQILNSVGEGIYGLDINGFTTFANPAAKKMLGYSLEEMQNISQHDLIHHSRADGSIYPREECNIYKSFKTGLTERVSDEVFWKKDGSSFPVEYITKPIIDNGKITGSVVTFSDISSRKKTEDSLLLSEKRFRSIFENSPFGVALIDNVTGQIYEANNKFEEISGVTVLQKQTINWMSLTHPEDIESDLISLKKLQSGEIKDFSVKKRYVRPDGKKGWIHKTVTPFLTRDSSTSMHLAMIEDITESKQIEETLALSEKRFRTIFEESPLGVALIDSLSGHIYELNQRYAEISGRSIEEMKTINWMSITHPDDIQKDLDNMTALNSGEIDGFKMEKRYIRPDNSLVWISMTIAPISVSDKTKPLHLAMIEDITKKKKTEEDLQKYQNHLEDEINKRTRELKESQKRLIHSEKLSTLGKFAGTVAHEFNNPLFGVINLIEQMEEGLTSEERKKFSKLAKKECWRMADMIKNLQSFYKPSEENFTINQMDELIEEVLLITSKACKDKQIEIHKNFQAATFSFEGIEDQIKQVILNLIRNSTDSITEDGGMISLSLAITSTDILLEIQDTGKGIEKDNMKFIFDPFYTTKGKDGTGLGLSVSYGIIKNHGGDILIESELGIGSTATLIMPIRRKS